MRGLPFGFLFVLLTASGCASPRSASNIAPLAEPALLGTVSGVTFVDGGVSGLDTFEGAFVAVTDRGPNAEAERLVGRPAKLFPLPSYTPTLLFLALDGGDVVIRQRLPLRAPDGSLVSGRPVPAAEGADVVESAIDADGQPLAPDPWGIDSEGVAVAPGGFWIADEYRPSLWFVDREGRAQTRYTPTPSAPEDRPLPRALLRRTANRGFEGIGVWPSGRVVAALQSPLDPPEASGANGATVLGRLLALDPATGDASTVAYAMEGPFRKIGDLATLGEGRLLILEHGPAGEDPLGPWSGEVYLLDVRDAEPVPDALALEDGRSPEASGVRLAAKTLVLNLLDAGWPADLTKPEGLAVLDARTLAVINDNDYGLDAPALDGVFVETGQGTVLMRLPLAKPLLLDGD